MYFQVIIASIPMFVCAFWAITILSSYRTNNKAKTSLGILLIVGFFLYLGHPVFFIRDYELYTILDPIYIFTSLAIYPAFYLHIRLLTIDATCKRRKNWIVIPALLISINATILYLLMSVEERNAYIHLILYKEPGYFDFSILGKLQILNLHIKEFLFLVQIVMVFYYSNKLILSYNNNIYNFFSNTEGKSYNWTKKRVFIFFFISTFGVFLNFMGKSFFMENYLFIIPSVYFGIFFYLVGLLGSKQNYTIENLEEDIKEESVLKTSFYDENRDNLKKKIIHLLEEKQLYKQRDLRITDISNLLNTNRTYISQIINNELESSFSDFVNQYRINYSKELISNPKNKNYCLDYISEQSGFSSLNSFLRAFKKEEGITPGQFKATLE